MIERVKTFRPRQVGRLGLCVVAVAAAILAAGRAGAAEAGEILRTSGVQGGLVVHIGCGEGTLTAALHAGDSFLVHGLGTDAALIAKARRHIQSLGLYGKVSVETFDGAHLPYVDNLANLVVAETLGEVKMPEVLRVLAPGGVAMIGGTKTVKPRPATIDEWTHYLHDASGNAVARDEQVGSPRRIQWTAGPKRTRDHDALASMSAMTTSGGRMFYIFDQGPTSLIHRPPAWKLIARDAFNGVLLWKRDIPTWVTHLWLFRSGPAQMSRRLVSVGDRVYATLGFDAPVAVLDAATGKTIRTFAGSDRTEEMILHKGTLLTVRGDPEAMNDEAPKVFGYWQLSVKRKPTVDKSIVAYDAETGKVLWKKTGKSLAYVAPLSLIAWGDNAFYLDNESLHCLKLSDGTEVWKAPFATEGLFLRNYTPTVVASDGVVMCLTWDRFHAFSIADGRKMWEHKGSMGFASPADLFVIDGLAWTIPLTSSIWKDNRIGKDGKIVSGVAIPRTNFLGDGGKEIWGVDVQTGAVKKTFTRAKVLPGGHHHRCYRNKATDRFLICGRRGLEYVDLRGEDHVNNWWVRGICQYGVMPANGMIYVPADPCQCFNLIKVNGFLAMSARNSLDRIQGAPAPALEKGPAYSAEASKPPAKPAAAPNPPARALAWQAPIRPEKPDEWPTYRGDITRSGSTASHVGAKLKVLWRERIGGQPTASVVADNKVLVCSKDAHTVHCLRADTGKALWRFEAGGRVDSPPTVSEGLCVFGCADGWIYCLRADDAAEVWRYRVAPVDRRVVADSRLESVWPASGSVLVQGGVVYCAAGRSSYLDGGIRLVGLDLHSGKKLHAATITARPVYPGKPASSEPSVGALPDVLVSDGQRINMRHLQFDTALTLQPRGQFRTLLASTGLLEDLWAHRQNWVLGHRGAIGTTTRAAGLGTARASGPTQGKLIVFDGRSAYGAHNLYTGLKYTRALWPDSHDGHLHQKYSRYETGQFRVGTTISSGRNGAPGGSTPAKRRGKGKKPAAKPAAKAPAEPAAGGWTVTDAIQPRAMLLADPVLFLAGWRDAVAIHEKTGRPLDPKNPDPRSTLLRALSTADGKTLAEYPLDCEVVFDGMSAAYGRLYVSLKDGTVMCMGPAQ